MMEHMRALREEFPYAKRYFENTLSKRDLGEDGLSESSAGSYEAQEKWNEEQYRKLIMNFNRNQVQYAVNRQVKDLAMQKDPENISAIERQ